MARALSGRFDAVYYNDDLALVIDYKTGFNEPDPIEDNAQMRVLAVLVAMHLPSVKEVVVQIVSGPYGVTEKRYSMAELGVAYNEIVATLKALNAQDAALNPSPEACKHCAAKLICQAFRDAAIKPLTRLQVSQLPTDGERAAKVLEQIEMTAKWIVEAKRFYASLFDDPTYRIPGWEMVPGNILREVTDWDVARARLGEYLDIKQLNSAADYRLGELEKALGKKLQLKAPQAKERMNQILEGLIEQKQNASSLKRVKGEAKVASLGAEKEAQYLPAISSSPFFKV